MSNKIIILAAGKGTRMQSDLPKALFPINGRPMITYLLDSVFSSGIDDRPTIVVSPENKSAITEQLKNYKVDFAIQDSPLGTGHAVSSAKNNINPKTKNILVLYADQPFISENSIKSLLKNHKSQVSMLTVLLNDFNDWRRNFYHWGRIIRESDIIREIIEFKDSNEAIKEILEVNPAVFCFENEWLFKNINNLKNNNNQKEYYLTDLIKIAFEQNIIINSFPIEAIEAVGVNSLEELEVAQNLSQKFKY